ncbi:MAG: beta-L-arabinofuranosidase domain-containing protein [Ginsengibacter sp.]
MAQKEDAFNKIRTLPEKLQSLSFGDIKPGGWLKEQVEQNLAGFTGHLDSLAPSLIVEDEIYGRGRLSNKIKHKDVGALGDAGDWQAQFLWWNSESQSNWWDGYIRSAILTGNQQDLQKIRKHIQYILSTQDANGYLGIYDQDLRYKFDNENGELWAKTTLLRGLLAWYEAYKDKTLLTAIERAVQNVMDNYPVNASHPFYSIKLDVGGLSHGLAFTDVLENLYRITKKHSYLAYAFFLYKDFSEQKLNEDAQLKKLLDTSLLLKGHGVHTYEHLRSVAAAYYASANPQLKLALNNFLYKIKLTTSASGGPVGDEWIGGKKADATSRGYEYCSLQELMNSYTDLLTKSGGSNYADKAEKLFFNAAQGSRDPDESCIAYLKSDNSYYMTGGLNGDTTVKNQTRYTYSPVHQEAAVCCVPNAGRIAPYYIQSMWLKNRNDIVAALLGPCILNTIFNGKRISIKEKTNYPYSYTIDFEISADNATFGLRIRKPSWVKKFSVSEDYKEEDGFIIINKKWNGNEIIKIQFFPEVKVEQDNNGENYFTYGALVLAHPIESITDTTKTFSLPGFYNLKYSPKNLVIYQYAKNEVIQTDKEKLVFKTSLINPVTRHEEEVSLQPMGQTILRQVTFKWP